MVAPDIASLARILLFAVCGLWPRIFQRIPHPIHLNTDGVSRFTRLYDSAKGATVRQSERKEQTGGWLAAGGPFLARRRPAAGGWRVQGLVCAASVMGFDTVP